MHVLDGGGLINFRFTLYSTLCVVGRAPRAGVRLAGEVASSARRHAPSKSGIRTCSTRQSQPTHRRIARRRWTRRPRRPMQLRGTAWFFVPRSALNVNFCAVDRTNANAFARQEKKDLEPVQIDTKSTQPTYTSVRTRRRRTPSRRPRTTAARPRRRRPPRRAARV